MDILRFALICLHFLAWPVVALGYPLIASIRAVETGSIYHMRKLVIYWTLFALLSLFEFAFAKIIQQIPFWSNIRLVAIFWLVLPQFDGACNAYQTLVRLFLSANRQAVIDKQKEKRETSMDIAEKNIKKKGSKALENLIASKQECSDPQREIKVTEAKLKQPDAARQEDVKLQIQPLKEALQQEWRCDLCQVKTSSENNLKDHLRGRIHKANCQSLKAVMLNAKDTGPSAKPEHHLKAKEGQIRHCNVCDLKMLTDAHFFSHLRGKRHLSNIQKLASP